MRIRACIGFSSMSLPSRGRLSQNVVPLLPVIFKVSCGHYSKHELPNIANFLFSQCEHNF